MKLMLRGTGAFLLIFTAHAVSFAWGDIVPEPAPLKGCVAGGVAAIQANAHRASPPAIREFVDGEKIPQKVLDPERLKKHVKIYDLNDPPSAHALAQLDEGIHVFLFDNRNRVAVMNRTVPLEPGETLNDNSTFLGSHKGLEIVLKSQGDEPFEVVSAGEIRIRRGGRVEYVNNASGSWRGSERNLEYARDTLPALGLRMNEETRLGDYSKKPDKIHEDAVRQVRAELRIKADPKLSEVYEETHEVMALYARGGAEVEKRIKGLMASTEDKETYDALFYFTMFRKQWKWPETEFIVVETAIENMGTPQKYRKMLELVRSLSLAN
jgi:hypothetical protein